MVMIRGIRRLERLAAGIRRAWYLRRFLWFECPNHVRILLGDQVLFNVPVRGDGCGSIAVGASTAFGYRPATRFGNGEILIQARSPNSEIVIGQRNRFNNNVSIIANERISLGDDCLIGDAVAIMDCDFHEINPAMRTKGCGPTKPVAIGNNVWVGSRAMILKGVTIGDNAIIAAMSVVTRSIPPNSIAAGIPAKVVQAIE